MNLAFYRTFAQSREYGVLVTDEVYDETGQSCVQVARSQSNHAERLRLL